MDVIDSVSPFEVGRYLRSPLPFGLLSLRSVTRDGSMSISVLAGESVAVDGRPLTSSWLPL